MTKQEILKKVNKAFDLNQSKEFESFIFIIDGEVGTTLGKNGKLNNLLGLLKYWELWFKQLIKHDLNK